MNNISKVDPEFIDDDNPEWTDETFAKARRGSVATSVVRRGKQKAPLKMPISLRIDAEVLSFFRSQGKGWQTKMNDVLKAWVERHS
ncbi:BrnA antitoxin family protein [Pelistega suis]|uniref:BrnA antitoxin family protein n=1 Tax=Pelistega suis TaxID=1631957 RepID=UPI00211BF58A|nr:BrnA antitoxin family protein [Pelistega suis]MCQ9328336.1 BrnA antitoxin family protein [Pelistega suis]